MERSSPLAVESPSVEGLGVGDGHGVQDLVQQLQSSVQVDLDPARRLLDALPGVVGPPALHEAHPQDAQPAKVVHADAGGGRQTCGRGTDGTVTVTCPSFPCVQQ